MQSTGGNPYAQLLQAASMVKNCKIAVAGGISEDTIEDICRLGPDVVIVGGAIHKRTDYISAAGKIHCGIRRVCQEVSDHGTSHC
jgi:3-hexulose-6-phosphate synthase